MILGYCTICMIVFVKCLFVGLSFAATETEHKHLSLVQVEAINDFGRHAFLDVIAPTVKRTISEEFESRRPDRLWAPPIL